MKNFDAIYQSKLKNVEGALDLIQSHDYIFSGQSAGEPTALLDHLQYLKTTGVKGVTLNTCLPTKDYLWLHDETMRGVMEHNSWFFTGAVRESQKKQLSSAIPQNSTTALSKTLDRIAAEHRRPVLFSTVAPMDKNGYLSLSVSTVYERDLIDAGALVIVKVNPNYPRTFGDTNVHISEVAALVESDRPIPYIQLAPYTDVDAEIGRQIATLVEDGSTLQLGIGNIPNAVAFELRNKKHLGIHTEMFTETMIDLIECGAVDNTVKGLNNNFSIASFTLGSQRVYDYIDNNPSVLFKSCTYANDPYTIGQNNKFVSINATLEVDLTGQCASETLGSVQWSGTGGQSETVRGAQMSKGGKSIIACHSTYKDESGQLHSKIVPFLAQGAVVSTSRNDTDYVVTEYGIAWLRGLNVRERAEALIAIAHPDFREKLRLAANNEKIW